jgi:hypothetical protein
MIRLNGRASVKAVPPRVERSGLAWPTDNPEAFDARLDALVEAFPEQSDNLHRLREIVHEATSSPTDPAAQDRLEAEYDTVIDLIDERTAASTDLTLVRDDP